MLNVCHSISESVQELEFAQYKNYGKSTRIVLKWGIIGQVQAALFNLEIRLYHTAVTFRSDIQP